jgi:hypothetical protein
MRIEMGDTQRFFQFLSFQCIFGLIILLIAFSTPNPIEPENLADETWSYYRDHPDIVVFLAKFRFEVLLLLFCCLIIPDIIWVFMKKREKIKQLFF